MPQDTTTTREAILYVKSVTDRHPFDGLFFRTIWISRHQNG